MISVSSTAAVKKGNMGRAWAIVLVVFLAGFCMPANMGKTMWLAPLVMQGLEFGPDVHEPRLVKRHPRLECRHVHRHLDVLRTMLCVQAKGAIEMLRENWDGAVSLSKRVLSLVDADDAAPEAEELQDELSLGLYALTSREQEVLKMLNAGMSRKEIGTAMSISENTVKSHLKNVYSKLGVHTRSEAYRATLESDEGQENA